MPDNLRDRIAAILHAHTLAENDPVFWRCCCTAYSDSFKDDYIAHDAHVADAVIAALDSRGWLIDPESGDRRRRASNRRWLKGEDDHD